MKRRILSLALALVLLLGALPLMAAADEAKNPFVDVKETDWFYDAVLWAYENGVTKGVDTTHFGPDSTVTREQAVTFLWRAMGEPKPANPETPFVDLTQDYYKTAVAWAVEEGITKGVDATHFDPEGTCSTMHIITFLYRTIGMGPDGWGQVGADWAAKEALMKDTGLDVSNAMCPRAAVVTTLDRTVGEAANLTQLPEGVEAETEEPQEAQKTSALDVEDSAWLSVDCVDVPAGVATELQFTLYPSFIADAVPLYYDGTEVSKLTDPDQDGVYTGSYTVMASVANPHRFVAKLSLGGKTVESNEVVIQVSAPENPEREKHIEEVLPAVEGLMSSAVADLPADASEEDKAEARSKAIYNYLNGKTGYWTDGGPDLAGTVSSRSWVPGAVSDLRRGTEADGDPYTVYYTIDGAEYFAECIADEADTEGGYDSYAWTDGELRLLDGGDSWFTTTQEKAVVLGHFEKYSDETMARSARECVETLKKAGYQVDERYNFKVSDFYDLENYAVIIIRSHGYQCSVCTQEVQTASNRKTYKTEIDNQLVSGGTGIDGVTEYYIKPAFFTHYYKNSGNYLSARWVHFGMCQGMNDSSLSDAVLNAGADCVTGFLRSVYTTYSTDVIAEMLATLLKGKTVQQAVDAAKAEYGENDDHGKYVNGTWVNDPDRSAILQIAGVSSTRIHNQLSNGGFEYRRLSGLQMRYYPKTSWRWAGEAKPVTRLGNYGVYGKYAAFLSTGGNAYSGGTQSLICQSILIPEDAKTISFSYRVFSEELGRSPIRNDHFYAALVDANGKTQKSLLNFNLNTYRNLFTYADCYLSTRERPAFTMPGWYRKTADVSAFQGKVVNLCFWVTDTSDSNYDTAVLIDKIVVQ